jgi:membrane-associated phospholipid phosphatase
MTVRRRGAAAAIGLLVAVCCAFATYAVHRVFVGTELGQVVDQATLEQAAALPVAVARSAEAVLSVFTLPLVLFACVVPPVLGLVRRSPWHALGALVLVAGANATTQLLKSYVFERPDLLALGAPNSLPSGHTTVAISVALGLALVVPPALRLPTAGVGVAGGLLVGLATIVAGWHRVSDVAAALLVCAAWAGLVLALVTLRPATVRAPAARV